MFKKVLFTAVLSLSISSQALEPLKDRAVVQHINVDLLLPDNSLLNVDMSLDCGSAYESTGIIVMSKGGAELIATAYSTLWGEAYGQKVMDTWNNKKNSDDPRKPTFIIIPTPGDISFNWQNSNESVSNKTVKLRTAAFNSVATSESNEISTPPVLMPACGTKNHDPER